MVGQECPTHKIKRIRVLVSNSQQGAVTVIALLQVFIRASQNDPPVCLGEFAEPVELGRCKENETRSRPLKPPQGHRAVIAEYDEVEIAREQVLLKPLPDGKVSVENLSTKIWIHEDRHGVDLQPGASRDFYPPVVLVIGSKTVTVQ